MKKYKCKECKGNCMGCFYTDLCDKWLDIAPYEPYYEVSDHASMALCEGRHAIPQAVDGAILILLSIHLMWKACSRKRTTS